MLAPSYMPLDRDIEGLIGEDDARDIISYEPSDDGRIGCIPADQAMRPKLEKITHLSGRRTPGWRKIDGFTRI